MRTLDENSFGSKAVYISYHYQRKLEFHLFVEPFILPEIYVRQGFISLERLYEIDVLRVIKDGCGEFILP
tara:strand:- start:779 stop:988 length:210 start_codon:yes stop_codon:yes gene_type:complete